MKQNKAKKIFYYRMEVVNKEGETLKFLGESSSDLDENARRTIIGKILNEGGRVKSMVLTDDKTTYPDEDKRRKY